MNFTPDTLTKIFSSKILFTDTDSLVYEIETEDDDDDFYGDKYLFDLSDYSRDSKIFHPVNKRVIGKMKDEFLGKKKLVNLLD